MAAAEPEEDLDYADEEEVMEYRAPPKRRKAAARGHLRPSSGNTMMDGQRAKAR